MAAKQLAYSDEARQKLLAGVSKLARAVRSTLGSRRPPIFALDHDGFIPPKLQAKSLTVPESAGRRPGRLHDQDPVGASQGFQLDHGGGSIGPEHDELISG